MLSKTWNPSQTTLSASSRTTPSGLSLVTIDSPVWLRQRASIPALAPSTVRSYLPAATVTVSS